MSIESFWRWFKDNEEFLSSEKSIIEATEEIQLVLSKVDTDAYANVAQTENKHRQLTFSANGNVDKFPVILEIVKSAPQLTKWEIVAFRQPITYDFSLTYGDVTLDPKMMRFIGYEDNDHLDLIIYGENFNRLDREELAEYCLIVIDKLVGEYKNTMLIRYIDIEDIGKLDEVENSVGLSDLPQFLNVFMESKSKKLN